MLWEQEHTTVGCSHTKQVRNLSLEKRRLHRAIYLFFSQKEEKVGLNGEEEAQQEH